MKETHNGKSNQFLLINDFVLGKGVDFKSLLNKGIVSFTVLDARK